MSVVHVRRQYSHHTTRSPPATGASALQFVDATCDTVYRSQLPLCRHLSTVHRPLSARTLVLLHSVESMTQSHLRGRRLWESSTVTVAHTRTAHSHPPRILAPVLSLSSSTVSAPVHIPLKAAALGL